MCDKFYFLTLCFAWTFEAGFFLTDLRIGYFGNTTKALHSHKNVAYSINYFTYYKF